MQRGGGPGGAGGGGGGAGGVGVKVHGVDEVPWVLIARMLQSLQDGRAFTPPSVATVTLSKRIPSITDSGSPVHVRYDLFR